MPSRQNINLLRNVTAMPLSGGQSPLCKRMRRDALALAECEGLAVFGVGFQYDREAPAGMPSGQVILDSDPNNCGFKVEHSELYGFAPIRPLKHHA
jgi:hypothetical protein